MSDENEYAPYADEYAADAAYEEFLNEVYPTVELGALRYDPADVLKNVDPVAYRVGFNDWLDAERENA